MTGNKAWFPLLLALQALVSAAPAIAAETMQQQGSRLVEERQALEAAIRLQLRHGEWAPALAAIQREVERSLASQGQALARPSLADLAAWQAVAEAGLGHEHEDEALWDWQVAQAMAGGPLLDRGELASYGAPGKLLAGQPPRRAGEAPAGLEVRSPGAAGPAAVEPAKRVSGDVPALPPAIRELPVPKWMTVELVVDAQGKPRDPVLLAGRLPELTYSVLQAVRGWRFAPATAGGAPVASFYALSINPPTGEPLEQLVRLDDTLSQIAALLREHKWEEADKRARNQWDRILDSRTHNVNDNEQGVTYLGVLFTLRALAAAGRGHDASAICRWQAAQTLNPLLFHAGLAAYGPPGELLEHNRWGASLPPSEATAKPPRAGSPGVSRPRILTRTNVHVPAYFGRASGNGRVILSVTIDRNGALRDPYLLSRSGWPTVDASALDAVCDWRFAPAMLDGKPVPVSYTLTVGIETKR